MVDVRKALYRWMTGVMADRGWTAAAWARRAEVTPTNLTRFLKDPDTASVPSAETIGRLAWAAGSEPRFLSDGPAAGFCRVPLLTLEQVRTVLVLTPPRCLQFLASVLREHGHCVLVDHHASDRALAIRITSHHMNAAGLVPDDRIVVEPVDLLPPRTGDLVVAIGSDCLCGYRYYHPLLVPVSTDSSCIPLTCDGAAIVGVAVHVVRPLHRTPAH